ncbi:amidase family protein (plasmid) [Thioclava sp. 'Guangxiensis']|uniref:amidase family protein n=1 Tax=Thioclava sp. 'Guangxiensis' TaxID=3149044 RepID=UPI0032C4059E
MKDTQTPDALWAWPATRLAAAIKSGDLSAREVALAHIARVEATNPAINAIVDFQPEKTLAAADAVDARRARGAAVGALAGVPVTIKVNVDQTGYATTNGLKAQKDLIARSNNPVVESFLAADAVPLGRTNTPAFSYRWFTNNLLHGATHNPRKRGLTPGGSSGGAGAAVAAGLGAIGHGTDIAGSVRYPAYACGVHGLRPSVGRVAAWNASGPDRTIGGQIMAVSGPLARTVGDLRLAFQAMLRPDACDPWAVPAPFHGADLPKRAALCTHPDGSETAPELVAALHAAAERLREAGWQVDEVELPALASAVPLQLTLWMGDGYEALLASAEAEGDPGALAALRGQAEFVKGLGPDAIAKALTERMAIARDWGLFMARYPVVLLPPSAELPFADNLDLADEASYRRVWTAQMSMIGLPVTGLPALTLNTGLLEDGTPVGVQIVAPKFREDVALGCAEAIEARGPQVRVALP